MRTMVLLVAVGLVLAAGCPPPHGAMAADAAQTVKAESLLGAWRGTWTADDGSAHGIGELILTRVPGRDTVIGQFTFVAGAHSRTLRYEGRIEDAVLLFTLVGGGRIALVPDQASGPEAARALEGRWIGASGALPSDAGTLTLDRVR